MLGPREFFDYLFQAEPRAERALLARIALNALPRSRAEKKWAPPECPVDASELLTLSALNRTVALGFLLWHALAVTVESPWSSGQKTALMRLAQGGGVSDSDAWALFLTVLPWQSLQVVTPK